MNDIYKMMGDAFNDPEMMKQYEQAMEEMAKMSPDELQQQMAQALNELTNDDMLAEILKQKESVIQNLQMTGAVDAEELARYRTDDAYFELKMRESFGEMQQMFNNPDYLKVASEAMGTVADSLQHPEKVFEGVAKMAGSLTDDDIEESRLRFLKGDFASDPFLGKAFDSPEMKEILQDAGKWRNAVKQGYEDVVKAGGSSMKDEL